MSYLSFISDEDLIKYTKELIDSAIKSEKKVEQNPYKNVIDPFSALVDAARQGISLDEWMNQEKSRQVQKTFQNAVGDFHQNILGSLPGWSSSGSGGSYDIINEDRKIIAEIKNKHNTMNANAARGVYDTMSRWLDYGKEGYVGYVVEVVPKSPKSYCAPFTTSERGIKRQTRDDLQRIDGKSFYALATGVDDAIDQLYSVLPSVISDITGVSDDKLRGTDGFRKIFEKAYIG